MVAPRRPLREEVEILDRDNEDPEELPLANKDFNANPSGTCGSKYANYAVGQSMKVDSTVEMREDVERDTKMGETTFNNRVTPQKKKSTSTGKYWH